MSDEVKNEAITIQDGTTINVDPKLVVESIDDVNAMFEGHVQLLNAVKSVINRFVADGMSPEDASAVAIEFHRRAAEKANQTVHIGDDKP